MKSRGFLNHQRKSRRTGLHEVSCVLQWNFKNLFLNQNWTNMSLKMMIKALSLYLPQKILN